MKLSYKRTFFVGLAFMSISAFWQMYDSITPLILKNVFGLGDTLQGAIMAVDNVLALFMLPLFGMLSDATKSPLGRRMPYILGGTAGALVFMAMVPAAVMSGSFVFFCVVLGLLLLTMATYRSPAVALMPDVTPKPLRSKGNAVINLMGALGGVVTLVLLSKLTPESASRNYFPIFLSVMAFMAVCILVLLWRVKEPEMVRQMHEESAAAGVDPDENAAEEPEAPAKAAPMAPDVKRSLVLILLSVFLWFMGYNAVITHFSKYVQVYWGIEGGGFANILMVATVSAVVSYLPAGFIASKIGRKKTILGGVLLLAAAFGAAVFFPGFTPLIFVFFALAGVGWATINVNSYPMVVEMSRGSDVGKYTGYYYTFSMAAQIVTPILSGAVLEFLGYAYLFPYGCLFVALSFFTMLTVRHGDSRPTPPADGLEVFEDM